MGRFHKSLLIEQQLCQIRSLVDDSRTKRIANQKNIFFLFFYFFSPLIFIEQKAIDCLLNKKAHYICKIVVNNFL